MDINHLANEDLFIKRFTTPCSSNMWLRWEKPRGCKFIYMLAIGGGGSGGGGMTGAAGSARGGGGGGGSAGITKGVFPAVLLPDELFVQIGLGGASPAAAIAGNAGANTLISVQQNSGAGFCVMSALPGGGGGAGTVGAGGAGGSAASAAGTGTAILMALANFLSSVGVIGGTGGAQTGATGGTSNSGQSIGGPGAGGGGTPIANTNFDGGGIAGNNLFSATPGGVAPSGAGVSGYQFYKPLIGSGGSGGATAGASGLAGRGGDATTFGGGGGGGGGGVTGGAGGRGGDGYVIIIAY